MNSDVNFLKNLKIEEPQGGDPFSMARAIAFTDLNTLAMEKRVHELIDLEQQALRQCRLNEGFDFYLDRVQLEKSLAFPVSSICEETITHFYSQSCNLKIEEHVKKNIDEDSSPIPEGLTSISRSPSEKKWIGWRSNPVLDMETCRFSDTEVAVYLSIDSKTKTCLKLPFSIPQQVAWDSTETRVALIGKPMDRVKLILLHLPTSLQITIDDFGASKPLCFGRMFFSPDGQYLYAEGINGQAFIFDTKEGKLVGGPFSVSGPCSGNPWSVSPHGAVFLYKNTLFLFHSSERKLYTFIQFSAQPNRLFFHPRYCAAVIGEHVWIYDGNTSLLAAPLFKMSSIDDIRLKPDRKIIFTIKDREETWQWQSPHLQSQMIPTGIQRVHTINVSPENTIWLLHDDKLLTIIDQNTAKRDTYSNVIYVWPNTGSFLINDGKYLRPQIATISGEKRFCNFQIPFAGKIQGEKTGKYLLVTSTVGSCVFPGFGQKTGRTLTCYHLKTDEPAWHCFHLSGKDMAQFTDDIQKTILYKETGGVILFDNETGEFIESDALPTDLKCEQPPVSPVENGYYRSEQIVAEYYDKYRDWFWLATAIGRVFTLERKTLLPTVVAFQLNTAVQTIKVTKSRGFFALPGYIFIDELCKK